VHGGYGLTSMLGGVRDRLAGQPQVVAIDYRAAVTHVTLTDRWASRPWATISPDWSGTSAWCRLTWGKLLGGGACLHCATRHPDRVRRVALVSVPYRRTQWRSAGATGWVIRCRRCTHRLVRHLGLPRRNGRRTRPNVDHSGR